MDRPNVTEFCDELKFNRFHWSLLVLGVLTLIFDGYDSQILVIRDAPRHQGVAL